MVGRMIATLILDTINAPKPSPKTWLPEDPPTLVVIRGMTPQHNAGTNAIKYPINKLTSSRKICNRFILKENQFRYKRFH